MVRTLKKDMCGDTHLIDSSRTMPLHLFLADVVLFRPISITSSTNRIISSIRAAHLYRDDLSAHALVKREWLEGGRSGLYFGSARAMRARRTSW